MRDNEIMTIEKAMFILRHGSAEGEHKYFEAVDVIEAEIEKLNVELVGMRGACESYKMHYDNAQAEIERLKRPLFVFKNNSLRRIDEQGIKSEAIKEFVKEIINNILPKYLYGKEETAQVDCINGYHHWECCGVSTAGSTYICKVCGKTKTENYNVDKSNITISSQ